MGAIQPTSSAYIPRYLLVPRRLITGKIDDSKPHRLFWGGRKPSKYCPTVEDRKHGLVK